MKTVDRASKIGKALVEAGEPEFMSSSGRVLAKLQNFGSDIPGYGRVEGAFSNWIRSPKSQQFRADVQALITPIRKGLYGSALTATELRNFEDMTATGKGYSEEAFKYAINTLIQDKMSAINSVKARDPEAYELYEKQRSGSFVKAPTGQVAVPQQVLPTSSTPKPKRSKAEIQAELDAINKQLNK
jgi:hypothetical protein